MLEEPEKGDLPPTHRRKERQTKDEAAGYTQAGGEGGAGVKEAAFLAFLGGERGVFSCSQSPPVARQVNSARVTMRCRRGREGDGSQGCCCRCRRRRSRNTGNPAWLPFPRQAQELRGPAGGTKVGLARGE